MNMKAGKRILIVDDDNLLRDFYSKVIVSEGYTATAVANGDDAIEALEQDSDFALAIIDLLMPVRTGWELIEFMKENDEYKDIPVIALTGLAASFNEFQKVEDACDAVMHKGNFELPEFISTINNIITKK
jgi:CheY-like chemotaxis protein